MKCLHLAAQAEGRLQMVVKMIFVRAPNFSSKIQKTSFQKSVLSKGYKWWEEAPSFTVWGSPSFMNPAASLPGKSCLETKTLNSGSQATSGSPRARPSLRPRAGAQQTLAGPAPPAAPGTRSPFLLSRPLLPHPDPAPSCCEARRPPPPHPADPPGAPRRRRHPSKPQPAAQSFRLGLLGYRVASVSIATRRLGTMAVGPQRAQGGAL